MNETNRIMAKANETMARSNREQLKVTQKVAAGEMTKAKALETLDELEKKGTWNSSPRSTRRLRDLINLSEE